MGTRAACNINLRRPAKAPSAAATTAPNATAHQLAAWSSLRTTVLRLDVVSMFGGSSVALLKLLAVGGRESRRANSALPGREGGLGGCDTPASPAPAPSPPRAAASTSSPVVGV